MKIIHLALPVGLSMSLGLSVVAQQSDTTLSAPSATPLGTPIASATPDARQQRKQAQEQRRARRQERMQNQDPVARQQRRQKRQREGNGTTNKKGAQDTNVATSPQEKTGAAVTSPSPAGNITPQPSPK